MAGITSQGLQIKRLPEILESLESKARAEFGSAINLQEDSLLAQLLAIFSAEVADLWEGVQGVYDASFPNSSTGINLDNVAALVGITRLAAKATDVDLRLTGVVNTVIPAGALFEQVSTGYQFQTGQSLTLSASSFNSALISISSVNPSTLYSVTIGGTTRSYTSGVSPTANDIASGLVTAINSPAFGVTASNNGDGTFTISLVGVEERTLSLSAGLTTTVVSRIINTLCTITGPVSVDPTTITIIKTPVFGLNSVTNPLAGVPGRNEETDSELRQRRLESVTIAGAATVDAIRAAIRQIEGVTTAIVVENDTNVTDGDGRPPKSFEVIVEGGADQDIGDTIWASKPAGIESFGDVPVVVVDSEGQQHTVYFSRPEIVYIHFDVVYELYNEEMFPSNGEQAIKDAMVAYGESLDVGDNVLLQRFLGPIYNAVAGLANVTVTVATSVDGITPGAYTGNNVNITASQVAAFATSRISVSEAP